jgi:exodeoxyribonuclease III
VRSNTAKEQSFTWALVTLAHWYLPVVDPESWIHGKSFGKIESKMKFMTYNIRDGAEASLPFVIEIVKRERPDYLTVTEANTFARAQNKILKAVAHEIGLLNYDIALSGEGNYHIAVFSTHPFKEVHKVQPLMRACVATTIETQLGRLSIASIHLTPHSEDLRLPEIDRIINFQKKYTHRMLIGDMNALSEHDHYSQEFIRRLNKIQLKKFTTHGHLRFDVIGKIMAVGYHDTALRLGRNNEHTVPTAVSNDAAHSTMRLDYIFTSETLLPYLTDYAVVKNDLTELASDHYPVLVNLGLLW